MWFDGKGWGKHKNLARRVRLGGLGGWFEGLILIGVTSELVVWIDG